MTTNQETIADESGREVRALRSAALSLSGDAVPNRIVLAPWGRVDSTHGRFVVDEEAARLAVEAFDTHGTDLPIDYEHQTLGGAYASPNGKAPAAGWIKGLSVETGVGLVAQIEWTDRAVKTLAAKEYRYLSPVAIIRKNDRKLVAIHSAALTNKPAIVGMEPIVSRAEPEDKPVSDDMIRSGAETIVESERGKKSDVSQGKLIATLRDELGLGQDSDEQTVLVAAGRRLSDLRGQAARQHVEDRIAEAMRAGKLTEAQRSWAEALAARDAALFDEWLRVAPVVVQPGLTAAPCGTDTHERARHATGSRARAEFRSNPALAALTTEEAYVTDALREVPH
jgi:phage I-like protein